MILSYLFSSFHLNILFSKKSRDDLRNLRINNSYKYVFFLCTPISGHEPRHYIIQHVVENNLPPPSGNPLPDPRWSPFNAPPLKDPLAPCRPLAPEDANSSRCSAPAEGPVMECLPLVGALHPGYSHRETPAWLLQVRDD